MIAEYTETIERLRARVAELESALAQLDWPGGWPAMEPGKHYIEGLTDLLPVWLIKEFLDRDPPTWEQVLRMMDEERDAFAGRGGPRKQAMQVYGECLTKLAATRRMEPEQSE